MQSGKHHFEAVSLLTPKNGKLNISIIPALGQPNWLVPTQLILAVCDEHERKLNYLWQHDKGVQEMPVYTLIPKEIAVEKIVVLEGNSDAHRLALQTAGDIQAVDVKISDIKDVTLDEEEWQIIQKSLPHTGASYDIKSIVYQAVMMNGEIYIVPDLDKIVHYLVDLDG